VVDEAARRRDDHVGPSAERLGLRAHPDAADDHGAADAPAVAEALDLLADLERELAGRREDERAGAGLAREPVDDGEEEGGGLAGAGGGGADDVAPEERGRDRLRLDRGGVLEPGALEGVERLGGEVQVCEGLRAQVVLLARAARGIEPAARRASVEAGCSFGIRAGRGDPGREFDEARWVETAVRCISRAARGGNVAAGRPCPVQSGRLR